MTVAGRGRGEAAKRAEGVRQGGALLERIACVPLRKHLLPLGRVDRRPKSKSAREVLEERLEKVDFLAPVLLLLIGRLGHPISSELCVQVGLMIPEGIQCSSVVPAVS